MTQKKRKRIQGVFFYPKKHELEALGIYSREKGVSVSYLVSQMFRHSFKQWKAGEYTPEISEVGIAEAAQVKVKEP